MSSQRKTAYPHIFYFFIIIFLFFTKHFSILYKFSSIIDSFQHQDRKNFIPSNNRRVFFQCNMCDADIDQCVLQPENTAVD